jgi:hypothetical protein
MLAVTIGCANGTAHSAAIKHLQRLQIVFRRPGGCSEEPEPDPIPNSAVKLLSADGTMSQDLGE